MENEKTNERVRKMIFASVYPLYIAKAERKGRTKKEVDEILKWLTGYTDAKLKAQIKKKIDFEHFWKRFCENNKIVKNWYK
jgi:hypothetical protein